MIKELIYTLIEIAAFAVVGYVITRIAMWRIDKYFDKFMKK